MPFSCLNLKVIIRLFFKWDIKHSTQDWFILKFKINFIIFNLEQLLIEDTHNNPIISHILNVMKFKV